MLCSACNIYFNGDGIDCSVCRKSFNLMVSSSTIASNVKYIKNDLRDLKASVEFNDARIVIVEMNTKEPFLDKLITDDEKWILYTNFKRHRSWMDQGADDQIAAKPGISD